MQRKNFMRFLLNSPTNIIRNAEAELVVNRARIFYCNLVRPGLGLT